MTLRLDDGDDGRATPRLGIGVSSASSVTVSWLSAMGVMKPVHAHIARVKYHKRSRTRCKGTRGGVHRTSSLVSGGDQTIEY